MSRFISSWWEKSLIWTFNALLMNTRNSHFSFSQLKKFLSNVTEMTKYKLLYSGNIDVIKTWNGVNKHFLQSSRVGYASIHKLMHHKFTVNIFKINIKRQKWNVVTWARSSFSIMMYFPQKYYFKDIKVAEYHGSRFESHRSFSISPFPLTCYHLPEILKKKKKKKPWCVSTEITWEINFSRGFWVAENTDWNPFAAFCIFKMDFSLPYS